MSKKKKITVERLEIESEDNCPECGTILRKYFGWGYTEWECPGCGYTETTKKMRPDDLI